VFCLMGFALSAISNDDSYKNEMQMNFMMLSDYQHNSWCTIRAWWKNKWCQTKALAQNGFDKNARAFQFQSCNVTYTSDVAACPNRMLEDASMTGENHNFDWSSCDLSATSKKYWCKVKAYATTNSTQKAINKLACDNQYNADYAKCPKRILENSIPKTESHKDDLFPCSTSWQSIPSLACYCNPKSSACATLENTSKKPFAPITSGFDQNRLLSHQSKHKSWCSFKAFSTKSWCKFKGVSLDKVQFALNMANCDAKYNLNVSQCAQRRLLKQLEKSMISGQEHKGYCEILNKLKWIGCKTKAVFTFDSKKRKAALEKCDETLSILNIACKPASFIQSIV